MSKEHGYTQEELVAMAEAFKAGISPAQLAGIEPQALESLYTLGYNLYTSENYTDAHTVFQALTLYKPDEYRFWMGLAGSRQQLEMWADAIGAYEAAGLNSGLKNPEPFLHAATCLLQLGKKEEAVATLEMLAIMSPDNPEFADIHSRAKSLLALLKGE